MKKLYQTPIVNQRSVNLMYVVALSYSDEETTQQLGKEREDMNAETHNPWKDGGLW